MDLGSREFGQAVCSQLWQVTALIVIVALAVRLFARNRPHLAHVLWLVVLVKCLTPPLWSSPTGLFCWLRTTSPFSSSEPVENQLVQDEPVTEIALTEESPRSSPLAELPPSSNGFEWHSTNGSEIDAESSAAASRPNRADTRVRRADVGGGQLSLARMAAAVWLAGSLALLGVYAGIWIRCLFLLRPSRRSLGTSLDALVTDLSQRLRVRRKVRLVITDRRVGPAVIGFFRPIIILPESVVRGQRADDLEPVLAHEIIHVRRGDVWLGALQLVVKALWWFHPLVWWSVRRASHETERCCDEEVIAELDCDRAAYARGLLRVLELRRSLVPVAVAPGVKPVDITSRRLERIMKLGQGCHKRTPWWCWLVLSISAVLSLPGAMLAVSADEEPATQQDANTREEKAQKNSNASDNTEKNGWIPGNDFHKLQGTWEVVSVQERGRTSRPNEQEQLVYSFLGKKLVVRDRSMPARYDCKYQIDPSKQPKRIDMRVTLDDDGKLETYEVRGIYRFEGDLLWICWEAEEDLGRPKSFSTRPEGQEIVSVFRRVVTGDPADVEKWRFAVECQLFESDKAHPKDKVLLAKDKLLVKDGVKNGCPLRLAGEPPRRPDVSSPSKKSERRPAPKPLSEVDRPRLDVLVCSLPDGRVHLDATVFNNDVVRRNPDTGELRVTGTNGRVVREVKLGDAVKVVCKQDASGKPTLWAELKVGIHRQQVVRNPKAKQGALRLPAVVPDKNGTGRLLFGLGNDSDAAVSGRVLLDERDVDDPRGKQLIPLRKVEGALPADFVVATINGAGIRLEEILSRYSNHLTVARQQQPPDEFRKRQEHLVRRELQEHVDRLLCVQAMRAKLSDEQWPLLARTIDKRFDALIERMSGEFKVSSRDELEAALARQGQSLEFLRKSFEQDTLEREYLALKLRRVAEKDRKAAISSIHSELRAKADVQTVFDAKRVFTFGGIPIRR